MLIVKCLLMVKCLLLETVNLIIHVPQDKSGDLRNNKNCSGITKNKIKRLVVLQIDSAHLHVFVSEIRVMFSIVCHASTTAWVEHRKCTDA